MCARLLSFSLPCSLLSVARLPPTLPHSACLPLGSRRVHLLLSHNSTASFRVCLCVCVCVCVCLYVCVRACVRARVRVPTDQHRGLPRSARRLPRAICLNIYRYRERYRYIQRVRVPLQTDTHLQTPIDTYRHSEQRAEPSLRTEELPIASENDASLSSRTRQQRLRVA